jgi:hypothetical protein
LQAFHTGMVLQLACVFRVAGEEEDLVIFREGVAMALTAAARWVLSMSVR